MVSHFGGNMYHFGENTYFQKNTYQGSYQPCQVVGDECKLPGMIEYGKYHYNGDEMIIEDVPGNTAVLKCEKQRCTGNISHMTQGIQWSFYFVSYKENGVNVADRVSAKNVEYNRKNGDLQVDFFTDNAKKDEPLVFPDYSE